MPALVAASPASHVPSRPEAEREQLEARQTIARWIADGVSASPPAYVRYLANAIARATRLLCEAGSSEGSSAAVASSVSLCPAQAHYPLAVDENFQKDKKEIELRVSEIESEPLASSRTRDMGWHRLSGCERDKASVQVGQKVPICSLAEATNQQDRHGCQSVKIVKRHEQRERLRHTNLAGNNCVSRRAAVPEQKISASVKISIAHGDPEEKRTTRLGPKRAPSPQSNPPVSRHSTEAREHQGGLGLSLLGEAVSYAFCEATPTEELEQLCSAVCDLVPIVLTHVIKIELQQQEHQGKAGSHGTASRMLASNSASGHSDWKASMLGDLDDASGVDARFPDRPTVKHETKSA
ncbi:hypothetical protein BESB_008220 [Besnoitia besnoiti]|uniref:Uncharacterized protein n=1 Tax=Besnoitia besnoiti TaxID=94643 RepID=A0A2A9MQR8_BESBE|nr:hypothetical protein BESB_008220 [Besnoitia besnoiti]PFH38480.1 hypothetical protein BESB_008220 [Besnoitia besnoiti]